MRVSELLQQDTMHASLRLKIGKYRSYERDTTSGGGSTSGASSSSTSSAGGAHSHRMFQVLGSLPPITSEAGYRARFSNGNDYDVIIRTAAGSPPDMYTRDAASDHTHGMSHSHTTPNHVHSQTYDIFEEGSFPGAVSVVLDGQNIDSIIGGPFQASSSQTTFEADLGDVLTSPGWHTLRFEAASGKGRLTPYILVKSLQLQ